MKVLFLNWNGYGNEDIISSLKTMNVELIVYPFDAHTDSDDKEFQDLFAQELKKSLPDVVLSYNYFPVISKVCNGEGVKYAAWVYDCPVVNLYSYTLINKCNYVFLFDSKMYQTFVSQGIKTVYYLPLPSALTRYDMITLSNEEKNRYGSDISFVGQMYLEKGNFYDRIADKISDYSKGYIQGIIRAQMEVYGADLIEGSIPENVLKDMVDALGLEPNYDGAETFDYLYSNYVIKRKMTSIERTEILKMIAAKHSVKLFTSEEYFKGEGITNMGSIDYYTQMPLVFKSSRINLNITLRSIINGIPLRIMDIMGCGGFALTNYQADMLMFFEPDVDFVYYDSRTDLMNKIDYYLLHEDERIRIAENGRARIKAGHTYEQRLEELLDIVLK